MCWDPNERCVFVFDWYLDLGVCTVTVQCKYTNITLKICTKVSFIDFSCSEMLTIHIRFLFLFSPTQDAKSLFTLRLYFYSASTSWSIFYSLIALERSWLRCFKIFMFGSVRPLTLIFGILISINLWLSMAERWLLFGSWWEAVLQDSCVFDVCVCFHPQVCLYFFTYSNIR